MKRIISTLAILLGFALGGVAQSVSFDFEDGTFQGWTTLDADGDGHCWEPSVGGMGHNSNGMVMAYSRDYATGDSLTPDEYLVSPRLVLKEDWAEIDFWVCALDEIYCAEHFGLAISTTVNDDPLAFTLLQEWTLTAKDAGNRQGNWYIRAIDLSDYAGQEVYVAIRHHYCWGQSAICVDDIRIDGTIQQEGLVITPTSLTFEAFPESHTVNIMNDTDVPVTISSAHVNQNDLWVMFWDLSSLPVTLQPGQSIDFELYLNAYGYKGYFSATAVFETSIGNRYLPININEEAWDDGLLVMPMQGLYFNEQEPMTQYFYLHNTNALQSITLYEIGEEGSNYFNIVPSHELPYEIPGGGSFEMAATLVNFPENTAEANFHYNSSDGEASIPFFHIAGSLTPGSGELMITPDTLWFDEIYQYEKTFIINNPTGHSVTITDISSDNQIVGDYYTDNHPLVGIYYWDNSIGRLCPMEEVLPITLEANGGIELIVDLEIVQPWAKRDEYVNVPINVISTAGLDVITLMIGKEATSFGLVTYPPYISLDYYNSEPFSVVSSEWNQPITITAIEEVGSNYLEIIPDSLLPMTLQNYGDFLGGSVRVRDGIHEFFETEIRISSSIGNVYIGVDNSLGFLAPFGNEWYYEIQNENGSITYQYMYQSGDTIVNDDPAHILVKINTLYDKDIHTDVSHEYVYEREGKLYWWNKTLEEFTVLYDFSAEVGDEWEIKVGTESLIMHVDGEDYIEFEGVFYRVMHVSDPEDLFSGDIVCGIGHLTSFFPERLMDNGDGMRVEGLRCYWVEDELVFKYGEEDCDAIYDELHGVEEDGPSTDSGTVMVYPNPTDGILNVRLPQCDSSTEYRISNLMGQTFMTGTINEGTKQIDVTALPQGMYFITIDDQTRKFVVK